MKILDYEGSVFYNIEKSGENYTIIRDFEHNQNYYLEYGGNFIFVGSKLYGIAVDKNNNASTYIFSYESSGDLFQKIIQSNQDKGFTPIGGLLQARDGRFYGVTNQGGGFGRGGIFSFNPATGLYTMHLPFNQQRGTISERSGSFSGLVQAVD